MIKKLICLFKHNYHNIEDLASGFQKIECKRCKKKWLAGATNYAFVPWNNNLENFSSEMNNMITRK
jgi:hypothetical protein